VKNINVHVKKEREEGEEEGVKTLIQQGSSPRIR